MANLWNNLLVIPWYIDFGMIGILAIGICYLLDVLGDAREEWK